MTDTRDKFRPEPIPAAIPASERGYFAVAPEPTRPGQFRLWLYGDGNRARPRSILLTLRDVRGLRAFLADIEKNLPGRASRDEDRRTGGPTACPRGGLMRFAAAVPDCITDGY
jgi:hypothetical protein